LVTSWQQQDEDQLITSMPLLWPSALARAAVYS